MYILILFNKIITQLVFHQNDNTSILNSFENNIIANPNTENKQHIPPFKPLQFENDNTFVIDPEKFRGRSRMRYPKLKFVPLVTQPKQGGGLKEVDLEPFVAFLESVKKNVASNGNVVGELQAAEPSGELQTMQENGDTKSVQENGEVLADETDGETKAVKENGNVQTEEPNGNQNEENKEIDGEKKEEEENK